MPVRRRALEAAARVGSTIGRRGGVLPVGTGRPDLELMAFAASCEAVTGVVEVELDAEAGEVEVGEEAIAGEWSG